MSIVVYYQDWASNNTDVSAWRMADLSVALSHDHITQVEMYVVRPGTKKNTFYLAMDLEDARKLRDQLNELLEE
jgi:hypothetical protein